MLCRKNEAGDGESGRWQERCFTWNVRHGFLEDCHLCIDPSEQVSEPRPRSRGSAFCTEGARTTYLKREEVQRVSSEAGASEQGQRAVSVCVCVHTCMLGFSRDTEPIGDAYIHICIFYR